MQTSQCLEGYPGGLPNLLKEEENEEDEQKKKEDDNEEEDMEGKRMDEEDMKDSLLVKEGIMVKLPLVIFVTFIFPLQFLL